MTDTPTPQSSEPKVVEVTVDGAQANTTNTQNQNNTPQQESQDTNANLSALIEANVLNVLTSVDMLATEEEVRQKNTELLSYLAKLIELLKEKQGECVTLEKQNAALTQQSKSLKEVVAIVKDLLNIRNMEVTHLQQDINSMQEKINNERVRQNTLIEKMEHVTKLNDSLKDEYHKQYAIFQDIRDKYELRVAMLMEENQKLIDFGKALQ